jgi:hypothetical protein
VEESVFAVTFGTNRSSEWKWSPLCLQGTFCSLYFPGTHLTHRVMSTANWFIRFSWHIPVVLRPIHVFFQYVCMNECFGIMCACMYCLLYCLYCVFVLFRLCIFILICFICTIVRTTATE